MKRMVCSFALLLGLFSSLPAHETHELIKGHYKLIDAKSGKTVTQRDHAGKYRLIFFGFTHCPLTCPLGLQTLESLLRGLGPAASKFQAIFITIDPARDDAKAMSAYLAGRDPRILGLTGGSRAVRHAMKNFRLEAEKVGQGESYLLEHPAILYVMDKEGHYLQTLPSQGPVDESLKALERLP